ncbi:MAG TPA: hypothetical protein VGI74_09280 [Streptosporangiaceae bacterium]
MDGTVVVTIAVITILVAVAGIALLSPAVYFAAFFLMICLLGATGFLMVLRTGAWLDHSTLVVRGAFKSRHFDLASAPVRLTADRMSGLPVLTAQDTVGRPVSVLLRESAERVPLAPPKLYALANAVLATGRQDPAGWEVAGNLRALAGAAPVIPPGR